MNRDFTGSPFPEDSPHAPHPPPPWMQAHLTECLSCLDDYTRLQSLASHRDPVRRRHGSGGPALVNLGAFVLEHRKFWRLPLVGLLVLLALFGGLIVLTQGAAVAPLIYTLW